MQNPFIKLHVLFEYKNKIINVYTHTHNQHKERLNHFYCILLKSILIEIQHKCAVYYFIDFYYHKSDGMHGKLLANVNPHMN